MSIQSIIAKIKIWDGTNTAAVTAANALKVDGSAATQPTSESQVIADNAAFTDGTSKLWPAGYVFDEVAGTALTENDAAAARVNANRAQVGIIEDGATRARYATVTAANALKVDGSAVTQPVTDSQAIADNAAFTDGTSKVFLAGHVFDETAGTALTENDAAAARIDSKRATIGVIEDETTRGTRLTIKAASTAPVAADKAAVVAVSPNSLVAVPTGGGGAASLPVKATAMAPVTYVATSSPQTTGALTANTDKQLLSIEHAGAATKTVRIHRITIDLTCTTAPAAAGTGQVRLYKGTAASSAGTALTSNPTNSARGGAEATVKVLPTIVAATAMDFRLGWLPAAAGPFNDWGNRNNVLYEWNPQLEDEPLTLPAATLSSFLVAVQHTSTPTFTFVPNIWYTEE